MFHFTPLLGALSESAASQSLLELDGGVKILLDIGWDEAFDVLALHALEEHVSSLSLVLLTHPTIAHLGAYAHCCKHVPLFARIPVYATTPVITLGRALLSDLYASSPLAASIIPTSFVSTSPDASSPTTTTATAPPSSSNLLLSPPTPEEIALYFARINPLKYSQPHQPISSPFSPDLGRLTVTAYAAGHTLGGTIWHIQHGLESIVYAADWNQGRENLVPGAAWLSSATGGAEIIEPLRRPTALVCSSKDVEKSNPLTRKKRDETLLSLIRETIAQGGKVLIPTDSSARVLELAFLLNQTWRENIDGPHADTYKNARIYMASRCSNDAVRYLQSMLEWIDDTARLEAETAMTKNKGQGTTHDPLEWNFVRRVERGSQVQRALTRSRPCVFLASDASLEWGFSKQALRALSADPRNLVILTEKITNVGSAEGQIGRQLWDMWHSQQSSLSTQSGVKVVDAGGAIMNVREASKAALNADEDALYQQHAARQRQMHSTLQGDSSANDATTTELADEQAESSSESEDEDEDAEHQGRALNPSAQLTQSNKRKVGLTDAELGINILLQRKSVHDYDVRHKRGREKVFPFVAHRNRHDDFGDMIKPEDYLRAEERDETAGVDMRSEPKPETSIGQKRQWDESAAGPKAGRPNKSQTKRAKVEAPPRKPDDIDAAIARATGQAGPADAANGTAAPDEESESGDESDYQPEESTSDVPQKLIFEQQSLTLRLKVTHVDFSGLHEKRDLQMLIPLIRPRKLILIAGTASETQLLAREFRELLGGEGEANPTDVFAPAVGEVVDASVDTNAWTLKLSRPLVRKLIWQSVKGLGIVALTGRLGVEVAADKVPGANEEDDDQGVVKKKPKLLQVDSTESVSAVEPAKPASVPDVPMPVLDLISSHASLSTTTSHHNPTRPVHVGDLRLASLRQLITASGHTAEFRGQGTLLIDGTVVVRKSASGRIEVEAGAGGLGAPAFQTREGEGSFYAVRRKVYEGLAVVGGV